MNCTIDLYWDNEISVADRLWEENTITFVVLPQLTPRGRTINTNSISRLSNLWGQKKKYVLLQQPLSSLPSFNLCSNLRQQTEHLTSGRSGQLEDLKKKEKKKVHRKYSSVQKNMFYRMEMVANTAWLSAFSCYNHVPIISHSQYCNITLAHILCHLLISFFCVHSDVMDSNSFNFLCIISGTLEIMTMYRHKLNNGLQKYRQT